MGGREAVLHAKAMQVQRSDSTRVEDEAEWNPSRPPRLVTESILFSGDTTSTINMFTSGCGDGRDEGLVRLDKRQYVRGSW